MEQTQRDRDIARLLQAREEARRIETLDRKIKQLNEAIREEQESEATVSSFALEDDNTADKIRYQHKEAFKRKQERVITIIGALFGLIALGVCVWSCIEIFPQVGKYVEEDETFIFKAVHVIIAGVLALANFVAASVIKQS